MAKTSVVFAESREGKLRRASLEAVSQARRLADGVSGTVEAVVVGKGVAALAGELASYGADRVHAFDEAGLPLYATETWARTVAQVVEAVRPWAVLVGHTAMGRDLAPRVAARVGGGLVSDCVALVVKGDRLEARRAMYSGMTLATVVWEGEPQFATLRPNVFPLTTRDTEYLPQARETIAMSELPNGASWYAYLVRYHTSTSMTPDEIHELGLSEVARIRAEMERIKNQCWPPG